MLFATAVGLKIDEQDQTCCTNFLELKLFHSIYKKLKFVERFLEKSNIGLR